MKLLTLLLSCVMLSGCMCIWTDHVFIVTAFKNVDTKELGLVADPNSTRIGSGETKTENDSIKASAIVGGVPVIVETGNNGSK